MVVNGGFNVYLLNGEVKIYTTVWYKYLYFIIRSYFIQYENYFNQKAAIITDGKSPLKSNN